MYSNNNGAPQAQQVETLTMAVAEPLVDQMVTAMYLVDKPTPSQKLSVALNVRSNHKQIFTDLAKFPIDKQRRCLKARYGEIMSAWVCNTVIRTVAYGTTTFDVDSFIEAGGAS